MVAWISALRFAGTRTARGAISLTAAVGVAAALSGCAATAKQGAGQGSPVKAVAVATTGSSHASPAPSDRPLPLPTMKYRPHFDLGVLTGGRLLFDGKCFYLNGPGGKLLESLVWPLGYSARSSPPRILDAHGNVVARAGQMISLGGSPVPLARGPQVLRSVHDPQCTAGAKELFFIN